MAQERETALTVQEREACQALVQQVFTQEQLVVFKRQVAYPEITDPELAYFAQVCQRTGLDPMAKEIYAVGRWDKDLGRKVMSVQVSIDGFRSKAEENSANGGGVDGVEKYWCGVDGQWTDVWLPDTPPAAAKVVLWKKGCSKAFTAVALYREYVQTNKHGQPTPMWKNMPANQLAKCAESAALRMAFPRKLGGLYTQDEMAQANNPAPVSVEDVTDAVVVEEETINCSAGIEALKGLDLAVDLRNTWLAECKEWDRSPRNKDVPPAFWDAYLRAVVEYTSHTLEWNHENHRIASVNKLLEDVNTGALASNGEDPFYSQMEAWVEKHSPKPVEVDSSNDREELLREISKGTGVEKTGDPVGEYLADPEDEGSWPDPNEPKDHMEVVQ